MALIQELRAESEGRRSEQQLGFFGPYSDLSFEEKVDFYRHGDLVLADIDVVLDPD